MATKKPASKKVNPTSKRKKKDEKGQRKDKRTKEEKYFETESIVLPPR